jgi:hypothetical protein
MQYWLSSHRWATQVDLHIFLAGWDMGEQSLSAVGGNPCIEQREKTI